GCAVTPVTWQALQINTNIAAGQWYHWAVQRVAGFGQLFFNGIGGTVTSTANWNGYNLGVGPNYVGFGYSSTFSGVESACYLDEIRVIRGVGRYSGVTYVPSTQPTIP